ncbi:hypothetical protein DSM21852_33780 [Methylocystis bryophila]|nr:hypothetical protein DSM21852_06020 [Methylocystis bryophila]BDV37554.1 hypothetical protein DSM21852_08070 [Methylocystis bryophila]BDV39336.1 hypothetical protein DSM21852_25890 [Methylocystis bryophila]BDV40125.1 hypothetical protein DSM21852_33780 [Methylocystis bryophila]
MRQAQQRPVVRVHRRANMQIKPAAAGRLDHRGVLDRQHVAIRATQTETLRRMRSHLAGAHIPIAKEAGQANFSRPIPAQPSHP